jgi:catechol 2,3-dioxygenase-like lactoylglutathione lyase family enzyme
MNSAPSSGTIVAILPCNDLDASERFYNRLGFVRRAESGDPDYRILSNRAGENWPAPGSEDTDLGVLMEPEVGHGETEVYARVQA